MFQESNIRISPITQLKKLWRGKRSDGQLPNQYWPQVIEFPESCTKIEAENKIQNNFALLGYACDEGVKRNNGRTGAKLGPDSIRRKLANLPIHFSNKRIFDIGNIECKLNELEYAQEQLQKKVSILLNKNTFPIVMGGSHDAAYGTFNGINDYLGNSNKRIGIINFDAHFDLRSFENMANSGTAFSQINYDQNQSGHNFDYFVIGIQRQSNTRELFQIADNFRVKYIDNYSCEVNNLSSVKKKIDKFISGLDSIFLSIDLDGFSSNYAPGVSAPSPLGFTPYFAIRVIEHLLKSNKIIACDIVELNPKYDIDETTASLASRLIDLIITKYKY
jgi:formiminoglutamase